MSFSLKHFLISVAIFTQVASAPLTIKDAIPEIALTEETKNGLNKSKEIEKTVDRENLVYRTNKYIYSFKNFRTINTFGRYIYNGKITFKKADESKVVS